MNFDKAIKIGIEAFKALNYADTYFYCLTQMAAALKDYIHQSGKHYSAKLSQKWLAENKSKWNHQKYLRMKRGLAVLDDIMKHGSVTDSLKPKEIRFRFQGLSNWSKAIIESHLKMLAFGHSCSQRIKNNYVKFFCFLENSGLNSINQITADFVVSFWKQNTNSDKMIKSCKSDINRCLCYLANTGIIKKETWLSIKYSDDSKYTALSAKLLAEFRGIAGNNWRQAITDFDLKCEILLKYLDKVNYYET